MKSASTILLAASFHTFLKIFKDILRASRRTFKLKTVM